MNKNTLIMRIEKHKKEMAKQRDALREIFEDLETEIDAFERGISLLEEAIDAISEVV